MHLRIGLVLDGSANTTPDPKQPDPAVFERRAARSGFMARAAQARARGVAGRFNATAEEIAAINACANSGASPAQVGAAATVTTGLPDVVGVTQTIDTLLTGRRTTTQIYSYGTPLPRKATSGTQGSVPGTAKAASANMGTDRAAPSRQPTRGCVPGRGVVQNGAGYCTGS
jgi:hypothetical protein